MVPWLHLFLDTPAEHLDAAARFWTAATGTTASSRRGEDGQFLTLVPHRGSPWVKLQGVDGPARVHLDVDTADRAASVERAARLGATPAWTYHDVVVVHSPGGLLLCHTLLDGEPRLERRDDVELDQVCIDVPWSRWDREVEFWAGLTGREPVGGTLPEFVRLLAPGHDRPRILLQRLEDEDGPVRAHPDLACADRAGDLQLHVGLGAEHLDEFDSWSVLRAPGGHVYCLTDRDPTTGAAGPTM